MFRSRTIQVSLEVGRFLSDQTGLDKTWRFDICRAERSNFFSQVSMFRLRVYYEAVGTVAGEFSKMKGMQVHCLLTAPDTRITHSSYMNTTGGVTRSPVDARQTGRRECAKSENNACHQYAPPEKHGPPVYAAQSTALYRETCSELI